MPIIALTGGIAAGKSTVARRLASHGAHVIDADVLARRAVEPGTPALAQLRAAFGTGILDSDGGLDRAALGRLVFSDPAARARVNGIVHPAVRELARQGIRAALRRDPEAVVVYDVPLLVEAGPGAADGYDAIITVEAAPERRIDRLVRLRGLTADEAGRRIAAQADDAARRAVADIVIDADGDLGHTHAQADAAWVKIRRLPAGRSALRQQEHGRQADERDR